MYCVNDIVVQAIQFLQQVQFLFDLKELRVLWNLLMKGVKVVFISDYAKIMWPKKTWVNIKKNLKNSYTFCFVHISKFSSDHKYKLFK